MGWQDDGAWRAAAVQDTQVSEMDDKDATSRPRRDSLGEAHSPTINGDPLAVRTPQRAVSESPLASAPSLQLAVIQPAISLPAVLTPNSPFPLTPTGRGVSDLARFGTPLEVGAVTHTPSARDSEAIAKLCGQCLEASMRMEDAVRMASSYRERCSSLLYACRKIQNVMEWLMRNSIKFGTKHERDLCERVLSALELGYARVCKYGHQTGCTKFVLHPRGSNKLDASKQDLEELAEGMETALDRMEDNSGNNLAAGYKMVERVVNPQSLPAGGRGSWRGQWAGQAPDMPLVVAHVPAGGVQQRANMYERKRIHRGGTLGFKVRCLGYQAGVSKLWWCTRMVENNMSNAIYVFDLATRERVALPDSVNCSKVLCFHVDLFGNMWTGHTDGEVRVWDVQGMLMYSKEMCQSSLTTIHTTSTSDVWMGSSKGNMRVMRWTPVQGEADLAPHPELELHCRISSEDGKRAFQGSVLCLLQTHAKQQWIWSVGGSGVNTLQVWCPNTYKRVHQPITDAALGEARHLAEPSDVTRAGERVRVVATAHESGRVALWDAGSAELLRVLGSKASPCRALTIGRGVLFTGQKDGSMHMWKLDDVENIREAPLRALVHKSQVLCILPTADGIMTSTRFGTVRFWPLLDIQNMFQVGEAHFSKHGTMPLPFKLRSNASICLEGLAPDTLTTNSLGSDDDWKAPVVNGKDSQSEELPIVRVLDLDPETEGVGAGEQAAQRPDAVPSDGTWVPPFLSGGASSNTAAQAGTSPLTGQGARVGSRDGIATGAGSPGLVRFPSLVRGRLSAEAGPRERRGADAPMEDSAGVGGTDQPSADALTMRNILGDGHAFEVQWSELEIQKSVGQGSFGQVYKGRWRASEVAVKVMTLSEVNYDKEMATFKKEVALLAGLRSPNVVMFMGVTTQEPKEPEKPPKVGMVMEYCGRGSLFDLLQQQRDKKMKPMPWTRRLQIAMDVAIGMNYLHTCNPPIVHHDLKSPNIMISVNWQAKIGDLGMSQIMEYSCIKGTLSINSPRWMAPEVLKGGSYDTSSDVYSFGVILWELYTLDVPWEDCTHPMQLIHQVVMEDQRLGIPDSPSQMTPPFGGQAELVELIQECFATDPAARPQFSGLVDRIRRIGEEAAREQRKKAGGPPPET